MHLPLIFDSWCSLIPRCSFLFFFFFFFRKYFLSDALRKKRRFLVVNLLQKSSAFEFCYYRPNEDGCGCWSTLVDPSLYSTHIRDSIIGIVRQVRWNHDNSKNSFVLYRSIRTMCWLCDISCPLLYMYTFHHHRSFERINEKIGNERKE